MPGDVIYTISERGSKNRLAMEENERKQEESAEKAQIENCVTKYQNGDTLKRERRYHARRNKASMSPAANQENSDEEKRSYGDALSTLPLQSKLKYFEDRQIKNSFVQTSPVPWRKHESPCDEEESERFQEIHKVRAELLEQKFSSGLYVKLPPLDQSDSAVQSPPTVQEKKRDFEQIPNGYGKMVKMNNNKEESEKEDYPCIVDCLYYSMQCCDCSLM